MKKQKTKPAIKTAAAVVIASLILAFIAASVWHNLKKLDYFKIKEVISSENNTIDLSYLKGENIFSLDLDKQAYYLSQLYPIYRKIRLIRILPGRIYVDFIRRKPLARLKLYKYFYVDADSVLFDVSAQTQTEDFPVILGLETRIFGPKPGKKFDVKELNTALGIIKEIQNNRYLRPCRIKKIDMTHPVNISVFLELSSKGAYPAAGAVSGGEVEVIMGQSDIRDKINILGAFIIQLKKDWFNIKYIDLRFKEPVVKFKDKKDVKK
ncbi:MAG: cell division protein FtsQ/DivIB [Candidatus Omnitrophica bacterium]|nr:cell division protein FtsQ/DivIB [Candidatus Omnitrophota bacterium]